MKRSTTLSVLLLAGTVAIAPSAEARRRRPSANTPSTTPATTPTPDPATTATANSATQAPAAPNPVADEARTLFERGVALYQDGRHADAIEAFEQSYRLRRTASVAMNMGIALRAVGRLVQARDRFREFFELASDRLRAQFEAEVRGYLNEIAGRIVTIKLTALEPSAAILMVDDRRVMPNDQLQIEIDPGRHVLFVEAEHFRPFRKTLEVREHETLELEIKLEAGTTDVRPAGEQTPTPPPPATPLTARWWFWTGLGVLVLGGVGVGVGVALSQPSDPPPVNTGLTFRL